MPRSNAQARQLRRALEYYPEHQREIAQRQVNAHNSFVENIMEQFGFTQAEAEQILTIYKRIKAIKLDSVMGRYNLIHGALWERETMQRALDMDRAGEI